MRFDKVFACRALVALVAPRDASSVPEVIPIESKTIPRAGRHEARHSRTGRSDAPRTRPLVFDPPKGKRPSWTTLRKHECSEPYVNRSCGVQNPEIPQARPSDAKRGAAAGRGDRGGAQRCAQGTTFRFRLPDQRKQPSWTFLRKHEQTKSYVNRITEYDNWFHSGPTAASRSQQLTTGPSLFCPCTILMQGMSGNQGTQRACGFSCGPVPVFDV